MQEPEAKRFSGGGPMPVVERLCKGLALKRLPRAHLQSAKGCQLGCVQGPKRAEGQAVGRYHGQARSVTSVQFWLRRISSMICW